MSDGVNQKKKKANCPCCFTSCDEIVYQNSGPIVRIYCSKCGLVYNEKDAWNNGFKDVIDFWNHIGVYMPQDWPQY